jgi:flagellar biosynthetic protein FliP
VSADRGNSSTAAHRARSSSRRPRRAGIGRLALLATVAVLALSAGAAPAAAQDSGAAGNGGSFYIPDFRGVLPQAQGGEAIGSSLQIMILLTVLTVAPSILLMMTCFVRMLVVLVLMRQAIGTQQLPPSQVVVGLAMFLTILVMGPTWDRIREKAVDPYLNGDMQQMDAITIAGGELRTFMLDQIEAAGNEQDVYMLYEYAVQRELEEGEQLTRAEVPMTALIPAFILSELKAAFTLGFRIYLPFLVIDMVIATVLVSMGMMMLPPVLISLPFKLLLFVLADGWHLIGGSLLASVAQ